MLRIRTKTITVLIAIMVCCCCIIWTLVGVTAAGMVFMRLEQPRNQNRPSKVTNDKTNTKPSKSNMQLNPSNSPQIQQHRNSPPPQSPPADPPLPQSQRSEPPLPQPQQRHKPQTHPSHPNTQTEPHQAKLRQDPPKKSRDPSDQQLIPPKPQNQSNQTKPTQSRPIPSDPHPNWSQKRQDPPKARTVLSNEQMIPPKSQNRSIHPKPPAIRAGTGSRDFPANPGISRWLYSLLQQQHQNPDLQKAFWKMKKFGKSHYKKGKAHYAWYIWPSQKEGDNDDAKTAIKNEEELKAALEPSLLEEEFQDQRAAKIEKWIWSIHFTADALNADNGDVLNEDDWRTGKLDWFIQNNGSYPMLQDRCDESLLTPTEKQFRTAFLELKKANKAFAARHRNDPK